VFGGRLCGPRARRGNRGSGFARARKQSQAVIVGGVSLEAAPPARQDDAETASIIVDGRKGLNDAFHPSLIVIIVASIVAISSSSVALSATTSPPQTVIVRPDRMTWPRATNRSPNAGASKFTLNSTVSMVVLGGARLIAA